MNKYEHNDCYHSFFYLYTPLKPMNAGKLNGLHFFLLLYLDEYAIFLNSSCRYSIDT